MKIWMKMWGGPPGPRPAPWPAWGRWQRSGWLAVLASGAAFAQCPICKRALVHSAEGARLAHGFNAGILLLLVVPFVLFGLIALLVHKAQRQAPRAEREI